MEIIIYSNRDFAGHWPRRKVIVFVVMMLGRQWSSSRSYWYCLGGENMVRNYLDSVPKQPHNSLHNPSGIRRFGRSVEAFAEGACRRRSGVEGQKGLTRERTRS